MSRSAEIGSLRVALGLDSAQFAAGTRKAQADLGRMAQSMDGQFKRLSGAFSGVASSLRASIGGLAASFSVLSVASFARSAVKDLADIKDQAERAGISVADLQSLTFAAKQGGGGQEDIVDAFKRLNRELDNARQGQGDLGKILDANNVKIADAQGRARPVKDIFYDIVDLAKNSGNAVDRAAVLTSAFGKSGQDLIPIFLDGAAALRKQEQAARDTGQVIDDKIIAKAAEFDDRWTATWDSWAAKGKAAAIEILDTFDQADERAEKVASAREAILRKGTRFAPTNTGPTASLAERLAAVSRSFGPASNLADKVDLPTVTKIPEGDDTPTKIIKIKKAVDATKPSFDALAEAAKRIFDETRTPIENYQAKLKELGTLLGARKIDTETYGRAVAQLKERFAQTVPVADELGASFAGVFQDNFKGWIDSALNGTFKLKNALAGLASQLSGLFIDNAFKSIFSGAGEHPLYGGKMGGLGTILKGLVGFASGGTILPGGYGGIDSQLVMFRKSPNERVDITKPGQTLTAGSGTVININQTIHAMGEQNMALVARRESYAAVQQAIKDEPRRMQERQLRTRS